MNKRPTIGFIVYFTVAIALAFYFSFAAVRGNLGVMERLAIESDLAELTQQRNVLATQVDALSNKTRRLSDSYLDLDLLDERARSVLGLMRTDELTIR